MRDKIFKKIEELQRREPTLKKFFVFSLEDLQDDQEGCLEVIEDFLESNKDKIEDFEFENWIDEATFSPVLMMKVSLVPDMSLHLTNNKIFNMLVPSSVESHLLREEIQGVLSRYQWEFNTEETRKSMINDLSFRLGTLDIEDRTTPDNIDQGILNIIIKKDGKDLTISEYLDLISEKKRFED
jgi:hypothetical protein